MLAASLSEENGREEQPKRGWSSLGIDTGLTIQKQEWYGFSRCINFQPNFETKMSFVKNNISRIISSIAIITVIARCGPMS